jgi:hypothetical protein
MGGSTRFSVLSLSFTSAMLINPRRKGFAFASTVSQASVLLLAAREVRGADRHVGKHVSIFFVGVSDEQMSLTRKARGATLRVCFRRFSAQFGTFLGVPGVDCG